MRKFPAFVAVAALSAALLTGCATAPAGSDASCFTPTGTAASLVKAEGPVGAAPKVDFASPLRPSEPSRAELVTGKGEQITTSAQSVVAGLTLANASTGEPLGRSEYSDELAQPFELSAWENAIPALAESLICAREGSRVSVVVPAADIPNAAQYQLAPNDSLLAVVDVKKVYLPRANGTPQTVLRNGLPNVVLGPDGRPGIVVPNLTPPAETDVTLLKKGEGQAVTKEDTVRVHYTGVLWDTNKVFDSSWGKQSAAFPLTQVVSGFTKGLEGQTVGSQVMIIVPPADGYGEKGSGAVPPNATLVFVVDILGIDTK